jgi:hypothetical protein
LKCRSSRPEATNENGRSTEKEAAFALASEGGASTVSDNSRPSAPQPPPADAVEGALAEALARATAADRWDVVAQLARELEARRTALAGNVVRLDLKRLRPGH